MIIRPCEEKDLKIIAAIEHASFPVAPWTYDQIVTEFKENDYHLKVSYNNMLIQYFFDKYEFQKVGD